MGKKWSIGEITFDTKEDYRAGQRDLKRIKKLVAGVDLDNAGEARELYRILKGQPFLFESEVGAAFRSCLLDRAQARVGRGASREEVPPGWPRDLKETPKEVKKIRPAADKKSRKKRCFLAAGMAACAGIVLFALYKLFSYDILSYISKKKMEELASCILVPYEAQVSEEHRIDDLVASGLYTRQEAQQKVQGEADGTGEGGILYQYSVLYGRNPDMAGWIRIEDTVVNYPVMLTPGEEEYYLKKGFDKKYDINGIPFMDARCTITEPVANYLVYGHNMKNGSMFSTLLKYEEEEFYLEHPLIYFDTVYETGVYGIIGAFRTAVAYEGEDVYRYYEFIRADGREEYGAYIDFVKKNSFYETGVTAEYGMQLLTLSTCDRSIEEGRFVVVARKMDSAGLDAGYAAE